MVTLAGALTVPALGLGHTAQGAASLPPVEAAAAESPELRPDGEAAFPPASCLASTICRLKDKVRWHAPAWSPQVCERIAEGVLASARKNDVSPALILAVMVNESDMNEKAAPVTMKNGRIYAKDSGLMGIRCVFGKGNGMCTNGYVKGMSWRKVMDPLTNIELGARQLSRWRTDGVVKKMVSVREGGHLVQKKKYVQCQHRNHAFWAHYNHGPLYIDHGFARHYPHRVAVLEYALARALGVEAPELKEVARITMHDRGQRDRTPDRPIEARFRKLCGQIDEVGGQCSNVASLSVGSKIN
ncbi:MAG TPA: transglycosylase SLT domain-containing protein [Polyangia bacterium]|nr:transglycosylase SLT domain-containing protein [Polyangia bacterium]